MTLPSSARAQGRYTRKLGSCRRLCGCKVPAKEMWYDKYGRTFYPEIHNWMGSNTKIYGAALFRLRKDDFADIDIIAEDPRPGRSPMRISNPAVAKQSTVHGQRGVDPTDPPASRPYLCPPVSHESRIQELQHALEREGHHPFPLPLGFLLDEKDGKLQRTSVCTRCDAFDGYPCLVNGKADAQGHLRRAGPQAGECHDPHQCVRRAPGDRADGPPCERGLCR
jgi:hypothetical protein